MPVFRYTAAEARSGAVRRGELAADSAAQVRAALRRMGLAPLRLTPVLGRERSRPGLAAADAPADERAGAQRGVAGGSTRWIAGAIARRPRAVRGRGPRLVELYENLAALLASGSPLQDSLETLAGDLTAPATATSEDAVPNRPERGVRADGGLAAAVTRGAARLGLRPGRAEQARSGRGPGVVRGLCWSLAESVREGRSLAAAMTDHPEWFTPVDVALVRAAEQSGDLERTLADLAEEHGRSDELRGRLAAALAYPAMLLCFGAAVVIFLTTTTLPQLAGVLADAGVALPGPTRVLLAVGDLLATRWWLAPPLCAAAVALAVWAARSPDLARLRLRLPLLGEALARDQIGAAAQQLARLLAGGTPLAEALALVSPGVRNAALRSAFDDARATLEAGRPVTASLAASGLFDPVFLRVLDVGQESGDLAGSLAALGRRMRAASRRSIDRLAAALEPAVILALAAAVGFVVYASIAPMLRLSQTF